MSKPVVLIGIGEIGGVFARGLLRCGHTVVPVTRSSDMNQVAAEAPDPQAVIVAVAETDLHSVLENLPASWKDRVGPQTPSAVLMKFTPSENILKTHL